MSQISKGIRSILSNPKIYNIFQSMWGASKIRENFVKEYIRPRHGDRVIDFGCGTAEILNFLPSVQYYGFDISSDYIRYAQTKFGGRAHFQPRMITEHDAPSLPKFDIALALGVLHHLDDEALLALLRAAFAVLKIGGRLLTLDGCYVTNQNVLARFLLKLDRGQNVRYPTEYSIKAQAIFPKVLTVVRHQVWIPYTYCIMECTK
ncbi:MAG: class I SAM-dependent methyltransferase [bacterium]